MFSAWGAFVYRHRRAVALISVALALATFPLAGLAQGVLSSGGWLVRGSESAEVLDRLAEDFGEGRSNIVVLFRAEGADASSPEVQDKVAASLSSLAADTDGPATAVITYRTAGNDARFISDDGTKTYAVVLLDATDE